SEFNLTQPNTKLTPRRPMASTRSSTVRSSSTRISVGGGSGGGSRGFSSTSLSAGGRSGGRKGVLSSASFRSGGGGGGGFGGFSASSAAMLSGPPPEIDRSILPVRTQEKDQIKGLNDRFANFIDKVRFLEQQNKVLEAQWRALHERGTVVSGLDGLFDAYTRGLKQQLESLSNNKLGLQNELQAMQGHVEDFKTK
uniref:IF rod domain-containing protein n=1 Tax=Petromyzon marinus TaxID=7757 RepID=S4RJ41_PETMA